MKLITICASIFLAATSAVAKSISTRGCPASIWAKPVSGALTDKSKYVRKKGPGADNVLVLNGMMKNGQPITVRVAANKNNKALDVMIGDAWLDIEDGADFDITSDDEVKECKVKKCEVSHLKRSEPVFSYQLGKLLSCGGELCGKTCNKFSCDYWGKEEDYSCKSLEQEYGCDCTGCKCQIDHKSCNNKLALLKCNGKSCDQWLVQSGGALTCQTLEKDFKCSCAGCGCKGPPKCDKKTQKVCTDAYKAPCKLGSAKGVCGPCIKGFKSDGKHGCVKVVVPNKCKCEGGVAAVGKACTKNGAVACVKCNTGKKLVNGKCVKVVVPNKCKCEGGVAAVGKACKKNGAVACVKCNTGKKLVKGKCVAAGPPCLGKCGLKQYQGDGNCDDANNNCGCKYDGGDCCAKSVKGGSVKTAYCKACQCKDPKYAVKGCKAVCKSPKYIGDGNCDDDNNNCACGYDKGDCCGNDVKKAYCKECKCKDPNYKPNTNCKGKCGLKEYQGDGNCDDENNNCGCKYDGGDCCAKSVKGGSVKTAYCKACQCKDPKYAVKGCKAVCKSPKYIGDGNCDDDNNNCACGYDKGDCCGKNVKKAYCKECKCKDPNYKEDKNCKGKCGLKQYKGDGNCDDENNNCGCEFDGGDCCAGSVKGGKVKTPYCKQCQCKDPKHAVKGCKAVCKSPQYIGDGNCDDENNNCACGYDKGDCCGKNVKKAYCKECKCKDPKFKEDKNCKGKCGAQQYKGDGNCDDDNNNCGCEFDGGDCCAGSVKGGKVKTAYCKQCQCKDPKHAVKGCKAKCTVPDYIGDGNCDDENNNCACGYDKGDCCGKNVKKAYCKECKCKDPKYKK